MTPPDPTPALERTRTYDGARTTELYCEGTGPAIVLLHGVFDRAQTWRLVLDRFAAAGRRAIAVNLPPIHHRRVGEPILPRLDSFVAAVIEAHAGTEGVVLVGNSMGAGLTLRAALNPALPVQVAVPVDIPGFGYRSLISASVGPYGPPESVLAGMRLPRSAFRTRVALRAAERTVYFRGRGVDTMDARHFLDFLRGAERLGDVLAAGRALLAEFDAGFPPGDPSPLLFVHGRDDRLIPFTAAYRACAHYRGSQVRILESSGHCPQLDQPRALTELILDFESRVSHAA
ncbi:alpha/beta hydrolase [Nocardia sp. NPDC052001]|uniref:alpha/beta fold hydrolase n=1 Tax=Nocardia sp. NPDC052001 TaxID=3154853 RepID=UPI00343F1104